MKGLKGSEKRKALKAMKKEFYSKFKRAVGGGKRRGRKARKAPKKPAPKKKPTAAAPAPKKP